MVITDWPANDYAIGAYIQSTVANMYIDAFKPKPDARILDIGCGDGSYSINILKLIPNGQLVGIDASDNMLNLAREKVNQYHNFAVEKADVRTMTYENEFDHVISFWCLQWTDDIEGAFQNIYKALKPGGTVFTLFPSGDDPFMMSYHAVQKSGEFKELDNFEPSMHYSALDNLEDKLKKASFTSINVNRTPRTIELPSLDVFRRFIHGIGYYQGQIEADKIIEINEAMVKWYDLYCQNEFDGHYLFQFSPYLVTGVK